MDMHQRNQVLLFATVSLSALAVCSILRRGKKNNHDDENGFGNDEYVVLSYFTKVAKELGLTREQQEETWRKLRTAHSEPGRYYHTLRHLRELLQLMHEFEGAIKDETCVILSILFHDVVYDPRSNRNEEDSACQFDAFAENVQLAPELRKKVCQYILATKQHDVSNSIDSDLQYFIDFDMSVLGRPRRTNETNAWGVSYEDYAGQIRLEYIHVARATYCEQRAAFLTSIVTSYDKPIFATKSCRARYEREARANMRWEAIELDAGRVPGHADE